MQEIRRDPPQFLEIDRDGETRRIAFLRQDGRGPTVVWLGGFRSDMRATKAETLSRWAYKNGHAFLRLDYGGHGESGGRFEDDTISDWLGDALAVIEGKTKGPVVLVGSSMGGWISLLAARQLPAGKLAGMVLIAPAVDFTETLMWDRLPPEIRRQIEETGLWLRPSAYSPEPYPITRPDRGWTQASAIRSTAQCRLPNLHPAGHEGR